MGYRGGTSAAADQTVITVLPAVGAGGGTGVRSPLKALGPVTRPTIVVWFSPDCAACRMSKNIFDALERNQAGMAVVRVEATPAVIARYRHHITALPLYDIIYPAPGQAATDNPLGIPDVVVHTVRNNDVEALRRLVPHLQVVVVSAA